MNQDRLRAFLQLHSAISWEKLADETGINRSTIGHFMRGERGLSKEVYLKLLFKCSNYSADPWMLNEAKKLHEELLKEGLIDDIKFK